MSEIDGVLITFFSSMVVTTILYLIIFSLKKPRVKKPADSPPETPVTVSI